MSVDRFQPGDRVTLRGRGERTLSGGRLRGVVLAPVVDEAPEAVAARGDYTVRVIWSDGMSDHYRPEQLRRVI
jgi:hypothetical protein